jgi:tRNA A-37 threonylcarbamoyl transferase component Bud32
LTQAPKNSSTKLIDEILNFCRHVAGNSKISAICILGSGDEREFGTVVEVLLIVQYFQPRLMNYIKTLANGNIVFYAVDEWVFERDIERGFLGEALASRLIFPYKPLMNEAYLRLNEVKLKKRLILELIENLALDYPEMACEFYILPEYFMYEAMLSRTRLFSPSISLLSKFVRQKAIMNTAENPLSGYCEALEKLQKENIISFADGYVRVSRNFIDKAKSPKTRFLNLMKNSQRAILTTLLNVFPEAVNIISQNTAMLLESQKTGTEEVKLGRQVENPQKHLFIRTAEGFVSMASKINIVSFAKRVLGAKSGSDIKIRELGGILNDVYLVEATLDSEVKKAVAKQYRDWSSFKWFPLALWTVGTRTFAVLGRSRLERECAMNQFLSSKKFFVPQILCISHSERLIFMQYVEGEDLGKTIKKMMTLSSPKEMKKCLNVINRVGKTFARVHKYDVALGDTKPENIMLGKNSEIYLMDFEQASRDGDKTWDVAEFLYYAGHYVPPFVDVSRVESIAKAFVKGYIEAGGDAKTVKKAATPKYTKVFSLFALPLVMLAISAVCRKADESVRKNG